MKDPVTIDEYYHLRELDAERALEALREQTLEELRESIKTDPDEKARLALLYAEAHEEEFLDWAAERLLDEQEPAHTEG